MVLAFSWSLVATQRALLLLKKLLPWKKLLLLKKLPLLKRLLLLKVRMPLAPWFSLRKASSNPLFLSPERRRNKKGPSNGRAFLLVLMKQFVEKRKPYPGM